MRDKVALKEYMMPRGSANKCEMDPNANTASEHDTESTFEEPRELPATVVTKPAGVIRLMRLVTTSATYKLPVVGSTVIPAI